MARCKRNLCRDRMRRKNRMALNKVYSRINWENSPSTKTALNEDNLNRIDYAVNEIDNRVISLNTAKADQSTVLNMLSGASWNDKTGVITLTKLNGEKIIFDLNIEKIPISFSLSSAGVLTMTTADGTKFTANIGAMIPVLTFRDSDTVAVSSTGSGVNKTYTFTVKDGSITEAKLQPNYLANVKTAAGQAQASAQNAAASETAVKTNADKASAAATAAEASKTAAAKSQTAAKASQDAAKASETASATSKTAAETAAATATQKATAASNSAATATQKEASAVKAASDALSSARIAEANAQTATDSSIEAKSYAIGGTGTRIGEDADNAKYYYEQAKSQANVPTKLSQLQNDTGFVTVAVDNLVHYYRSSQLYTKSEVDAKISAIPKFSIVAVTALPTTNISSTTIYLLKEGSAGTNKCSEWVYVSGAWEKLGDIDVDLSGYLTKTGDGSSLTEAFSEASALAKLTSGEKHSALFGKLAKAVSTLISHVTTAATTSVLGHVKVDSAMSSTSTNPVQNKIVNTALAGKLATTGNASNTTVAYTEAAALTELASGEKQSVAFGKLKLAVKNVISIARLLGSTDISAIGGGTVTGAISALNSNLTADHWLPAPGYDLLAASQNTALQIYSANPNILAAQGVPEALSPYGLYICMGRSEYNTMLYIDVFGSIGAWSENTKKWMNYTPIHIQNKITYGTNVSLYHHNNCTLMHKVVHFSLGITVSETTGSNILTIAEGYRGGWSKSLIMTNAVSNDTYALHYYSDSGTVAAFRPVPAGRYLIVG